MRVGPAVEGILLRRRTRLLEGFFVADDDISSDDVTCTQDLESVGQRAGGRVAGEAIGGLLACTAGEERCRAADQAEKELEERAARAG